MTMLLWAGFIVIVIGLLALDLGVLNRKAHVIGFREALGWTIYWIALGLLFTIAVYFAYEQNWLGIGLENGVAALTGMDAATKYLTGYIIEKSLSLDNIFVMALIFNFFGVRPEYQHRVLFWGILGALVMRAVMIILGTALIHQFSWLIEIFGLLLIYTAAKMLVADEEEFNPEKSRMVKLLRRFLPVSEHFEGKNFLTRIDGKIHATPMLMVLVLVEGADLMFAIDSIPAIFAITTDPFIVFTSNVFAILGLRSLYFVLASVIHQFKYLKLSLVFLLGYVGIKMLLHHVYKIDTVVSLAVIAGILSVGIMASVISNKRDRARRHALLNPTDGDGVAD